MNPHLLRDLRIGHRAYRHANGSMKTKTNKPTYPLLSIPHNIKQSESRVSPSPLFHKILLPPSPYSFSFPSLLSQVYKNISFLHQPYRNNVISYVSSSCSNESIYISLSIYHLGLESLGRTNYVKEY